MTLPLTTILPLRTDYTDQDLDRYLRDLLFALTNMYEGIAENVNGRIRGYNDPQGDYWLPSLQGTTPGTFTYVNQYGWSLRRGLITDLWFDIEWSASTATGNLYLELPYMAAVSDGRPFVGVVQSSSISFGTRMYMVINAIPGTFRGELWLCGTALADQNLAVPGSGRLMGSIRYLGAEDQ